MTKEFVIDLSDLEPSPSSQDQSEQEEKQRTLFDKIIDVIKDYFDKFKGGKSKRSPLLSWQEMIYSWISAFCGILFVAALHFNYLEEKHYVFIIGSFGASAVLIYGVPGAPFSQPRNFFGGNIISAIVGTIVRVLLADLANVPQIAAAVAVATAIVAMQITNTIHPPGGAVALIAVLSPPMMWDGFLYIFMPVVTGCLALGFVAFFVNNLFPGRSYPHFWW
mmetsp:Transcript_766/g.1061  ORF Transcript_766/g.1061 Transcript_766/m.1061 type:complete len:221 (+) Transcript_766:46-708(+)